MEKQKTPSPHIKVAGGRFQMADWIKVGHTNQTGFECMQGQDSNPDRRDQRAF